MACSRRCWVVLFWFMLSGCTAKPNLEPIQLAHLLPLTGSDRRAAESARRGMLLAVEEINAEDRRIGGRPVLVRNVDTHDDPELVQAEAVRLVTLNKVSALISGPDSRGAENLVRTVQPYASSPYHVSVVVPSDFPPGTGLNDFVPLTVAPARRGEILARYAVKELKPKRAIVLLDQRSPIAGALAAAFRQEWPRATPPNLEEWPYRNDTEQIDFAARLAKVGPAVVLFAGTVADFVKLQEQLPEAKAQVTLLYGGEDVDAAALQKPGVEVLTATVFSRDGLTEKGKEFASRYDERFREAVSFEAAQAYDAGRLLFDTMAQLKSGSATKLREELSRLKSFESVTGALTWKNHYAQRPVFILRLKDGQAQTVETVAPVEK